MSELGLLAGLAGFVILVQSAILKVLVTNNKLLVRALIARNSHELVVLDQSAAKAEIPRRQLSLPFGKPLPPDDDDYNDPIPLGL